jgi:RNA-directed DNA polymerase
VESAKLEPAGQCHSRAPLLDVPALRRASRRQRAAAAGGVEGVTKAQSGRNLESNLQDRHARLQDKRYHHQPIRRGHIPTAPGNTRPIGLAAFEDQLVQDAGREGLEAIDAQAFLDCSQGFRPGRGAHEAGRPRKRSGERGEGRWSYEADIVSFFESLERPKRKEMLGRRVADGALLRRMGQCVHVGGLDGATVVEPEWGPAQGAVLSPLFGNVYGHDALDRWCATEVTPRLQGKAPLLRYCDDFLIGCAREDEARRGVAVLDKRMGRFGLARHPDQPRLLPLRRPPKPQQSGKGPATFDFWGCPFSWARTRKGHWRMACTTRRASLRRATTSIYDWCCRHRHLSMQDQHAALQRRWRGHCNYFGLRGNYNSMMRLVDATKRAGYKWLRRRRQRTRLNWERCTDMLRWWPLPRPRIPVRIWDGSPRATSTEEPDGGNLLVRIWRGAGIG